jgi:hypothetical protein
MSSAIQHARDADRLRANTRPDVNERLDHNTELRLREAASRSKDGLTDRITDLGREWNFDRVIEVEASMTGLTGLVLGAFLDPRFLLMPGMAASMLLLHSVQGWYPLLPLLRRLGLRSQEEIDREYYALKALRGDFDDVADAAAAERAAAAWRAVLK